MRIPKKIAAFLMLSISQAGCAYAWKPGQAYSGGRWQESRPAFADRALSPSLPGWPKRAASKGEQAASDYLTANAGLFRFDRHTMAYQARQVENSEELETHRFGKTWNGLEVLGGDTLVHLRDGRVLFANGDNTPLDSLSPIPRISPETARAVAFSAFRGNALEASNPQLKVLIQGHGSDRKARLVYVVPVSDRAPLSGELVYVSGETAEELASESKGQTLGSRRVFVGFGTQEDFAVLSNDTIESSWPVLFADSGCGEQGGQPPPGEPRTCGKALPPAVVLNSALAAWENAGLVHDYFQTVHHRDSIDGRGMEIRSVVNFGGINFQNAAWYNNRLVMLYGMGNNEVYNDFASPLDVVGHELSHGVTASSAALRYFDESGALSESYSDVFGKLIAFYFGKADDWKVGKGLYRASGAFMRDMENPEVGHLRNYKYRGQICNRNNDFCGVHANSGITSKAAVLLASELGLNRLARIYYLTLTQLLRSNSDFSEARAQTEAACNVILGTNSADCAAVARAFSAVGIENGNEQEPL